MSSGKSCYDLMTKFITLPSCRQLDRTLRLYKVSIREEPEFIQLKKSLDILYNILEKYILLTLNKQHIYTHSIVTLFFVNASAPM